MKLQALILKLRALLHGESDTERSIRDKIEENYRTKREPKLKK